jgi:hypothetical protein
MKEDIKGAEQTTPSGDKTGSEIESVQYGWSLVGHWYVRIMTGANGQYGSHIVCTDEKQAIAIAESLRPLARVFVGGGD